MDKLIELNITKKGKYELIIGKTESKKSGDNDNGINHYKNCYFIGFFNKRRFDTFPLPCYPSDLEHIFDNDTDRFNICQWLNTQNLDEIISGDNSIFTYTLSSEEEMNLSDYLSED